MWESLWLSAEDTPSFFERLRLKTLEAPALFDFSYGSL